MHYWQIWHKNYIS